MSIFNNNIETGKKGLNYCMGVVYFMQCHMYQFKISAGGNSESKRNER